MSSTDTHQMAFDRVRSYISGGPPAKLGARKSTEALLVVCGTGFSTAWVDRAYLEKGCAFVYGPGRMGLALLEMFDSIMARPEASDLGKLPAVYHVTLKESHFFGGMILSSSSVKQGGAR